MRFLCVCEGGNVRSVGLAYVLKDMHKQDAVAIGWRYAGPETMAILCRWADKIIVMQSAFSQYIPAWAQEKVRALDVGEDRFGIYVHPELLSMCQNAADDWAGRNFAI